MTKQILLVGYHSYNLSSKRKPTLIHKTSTQIPLTFNQHDAAGKTIEYLGVNTLTHFFPIHPFSTP